MKLYALYQRLHNRGYYISFNPVTNQYRRISSVKSLQIWDVWEGEMIPHILKERGVKETYQFRLLGQHIVQQLSFHSRYTCPGCGLLLYGKAGLSIKCQCKKRKPMNEEPYYRLS